MSEAAPAADAPEMSNAATHKPRNLGESFLLVGTLAALVLLALLVSISTGADGAAPAFRSSSTAATSGPSTSVTVGKPGGVAAADVLLASVAVRNGSVQAPAGWQLVRSDDCEIHGERLTQAVFVRTASGSEPAGTGRRSPSASSSHGASSTTACSAGTTWSTRWQ